MTKTIGCLFGVPTRCECHSMSNGRGLTFVNFNLLIKRLIEEWLTIFKVNN